MSAVYIAKRQFAGKKVELSDISIRDGLQSLETIIDTETKVKYFSTTVIFLHSVEPCRAQQI